MTIERSYIFGAIKLYDGCPRLLAEVRAADVAGERARVRAADVAGERARVGAADVAGERARVGAADLAGERNVDFWMLWSVDGGVFEYIGCV